VLYTLDDKVYDIPRAFHDLKSRVPQGACGFETRPGTTTTNKRGHTFADLRGFWRGLRRSAAIG
jgi:hypothetical protein